MAQLPEPFSRFDLWWASYPRRVAKGAARKAWAKLKVDDAMLDRMLAALEWQREQEQWTRDGGHYIPHPATYLNREQFDDEPCDVAPAAGRTVAEKNLRGLRDDLAALDEFRRSGQTGGVDAVGAGDEGTVARAERGPGRLLPHLPRRAG